MRKLLMVLCLVPFWFAGCSGAQLPSIEAIENGLCLGKHNFVARADTPEGTRILEDHNGVLFCDVPGTFSGTLGGCVSMSSWDSGSWMSARKALDLDPLACVVSEDGSVRLCPANAPEKEDQ